MSNTDVDYVVVGAAVGTFLIACIMLFCGIAFINGILVLLGGIGLLVSLIVLFAKTDWDI